MGETVKEEAPEVIVGHKITQTMKAKWLCMKNAYEHLYRPAMYDLGGTYNAESAEYWFTYQTEQVGKIFLLHLFINSEDNASNYNFFLCKGSDLIFEDSNQAVYIKSAPTLCSFSDGNDTRYHYLTTYNFSDLDVEMIKDKNVYISISFSDHEDVNVKFQLDDVLSFHDFGGLMADPIDADFVMEASDGTKFNVHKFLLAKRSDVFRAMLKEDTAESQNSHVKLSDVDKEDLRCIVEFIYTGTVNDLDNCDCYNLLEYADRYNLKGLKDLSQYVLTQNLNNDNALQTLTMADMHNATCLKIAALKHIKRNITCLESSMFQKITSVNLVRELCQFVALH